MKAGSRSPFSMQYRTRQALQGLVFVLPWIMGFILFTMIPLVQTFLYSLNQVIVSATGVEPTYIQWENYTKALFTDPTFVELLIEIHLRQQRALDY